MRSEPLPIEDVRTALDFATEINLLAARAPVQLVNAENELRKVAEQIRQAFSTSRPLKKLYILKFIRNQGAGCTLRDLGEKFAMFTRPKINEIVCELEAEGKVERRKISRGKAGRPVSLITACQRC